MNSFVMPEHYGRAYPEINTSGRTLPPSPPGFDWRAPPPLGVGGYGSTTPLGGILLFFF